MSIYGNNIFSSLNESFKIFDKDIEDNDQYEVIEIISKNKSTFEKEVNKCSKNAYNNIDVNDGSCVNWERFKKENTKAPVITEISLYSDYYSFELSTKGKHDEPLFFQDKVIKELLSNEKLKSLGLTFWGEDYLGIYVKMK